MNQYQRQPQLPDSLEPNTPGKTTSRPVQHVGDYCLFEKIGEGKFGKVHLACRRDAYEVALETYRLEHPLDDDCHNFRLADNLPNEELFATKVISLHLQDDDAGSKSKQVREMMLKDQLEAIEVEVDILSKLRHDNAVRLIDQISHNHHLYLFLEYCSEGDLNDFIKKFNESRRSYMAKVNKYFSHYDSVQSSLADHMHRDIRDDRLSETAARYIVREVAKGLQYLNENNIIHRDIKLDNILVNRKVKVDEDARDESEPKIEDFEFKLGDMGLAKSLKSKNDLATTFAGTPLTMAPEVITGTAYGSKVDSWSLGTLLFQMLTGEHPFNASDMRDLRRKLEEGSYKIPSDVSLSADCIDFLGSCLRHDQPKRISVTGLLKHPFLCETSIRSKVATKGLDHSSASLVLNTRQSINVTTDLAQAVYNKYPTRRVRGKENNELSAIQEVESIRVQRQMTLGAEVSKIEPEADRTMQVNYPKLLSSSQERRKRNTLTPHFGKRMEAARKVPEQRMFADLYNQRQDRHSRSREHERQKREVSPSRVPDILPRRPTSYRPQVLPEPQKRRRIEPAMHVPYHRVDHRQPSEEGFDMLYVVQGALKMCLDLVWLLVSVGCHMSEYLNREEHRELKQRLTIAWIGSIIYTLYCYH